MINRIGRSDGENEEGSEAFLEGEKKIFFIFYVFIFLYFLNLIFLHLVFVVCAFGS